MPADVGAIENAAPWTKVGVVDWAPAVAESRTPRTAITARRAPERAAGKCFMVIPSSRGLELALDRHDTVAREVVFREVSNRRAGRHLPSFSSDASRRKGMHPPTAGPMDLTPSITRCRLRAERNRRLDDDGEAPAAKSTNPFSPDQRDGPTAVDAGDTEPRPGHPRTCERRAELG